MAFSDPRFNALRVVEMPLVTYQRSHLILLNELNPTDGALFLNYAWLYCVESGSNKGTQNLRDGQRYLHQSTYQPIVENIIGIHALSSLIDSVLN